jgi:L-alanine-DL-glutamate epimerase-like enolase superfamily enzyme
VQLRDGYLDIPETPGLGVELNESAIPDRPIRNWRRGAPMRTDGAADFI